MCQLKCSAKLLQSRGHDTIALGRFKSKPRQEDGSACWLQEPSQKKHCGCLLAAQAALLAQIQMRTKVERDGSKEAESCKSCTSGRCDWPIVALN